MSRVQCRVNIVNHRCDDSTVKLLANWSNQTDLKVFTLDDPRYIQSEVMTCLLKREQILGQADWVFFIDFDEFLNVSSRDELLTLLSGFPDDPVLSWRWRNLSISSDSYASLLTAQYSVSSHLSPYKKVAVNCSAAKEIGDLYVEQGNHEIRIRETGVIVPTVCVGIINHIPIRSKEQLAFKVRQGCAAYQDMPDAKEKKYGFHWLFLEEFLKSGTYWDCVKNYIVFYYSEIDELPAVSKSETAKTELLEQLKTIVGTPEPYQMNVARVEKQIDCAVSVLSEVPLIVTDLESEVLVVPDEMSIEIGASSTKLQRPVENGDRKIDSRLISPLEWVVDGSYLLPFYVLRFLGSLIKTKRFVVWGIQSANVYFSLSQCVRDFSRDTSVFGISFDDLGERRDDIIFIMRRNLKNIGSLVNIYDEIPAGLGLEANSSDVVVIDFTSPGVRKELREIITSHVGNASIVIGYKALIDGNLHNHVFMDAELTRRGYERVSLAGASDLHVYAAENVSVPVLHSEAFLALKRASRCEQELHKLRNELRFSHGHRDPPNTSIELAGLSRENQVNQVAKLKIVTIFRALLRRFVAAASVRLRLRAPHEAI